MILNNTIYVFHIRKHNGAGTYLHPFEDFDKIIATGNSFQLEGRYGEQPVIESLTAFRNTIYRIVEESVNNWVNESKFIPRFLISAATFLLAYFFYSFAIRTPIPMIDNIVFAIICAVICYFFLGRRYRETTTASKLRAHYRGIIDRIVFSQSNFITTLEAFLVRLSVKSVDEIIKNGTDCDEFTELMSDEHRDERNQLLSYIEKVLKKQLSGHQKRLVNKIIMTGMEKNAALVEELDLINVADEVDINLLFSYLLLREKNHKKTV
ncbi:MAG: hypothetical protein FWC36_02150 [Spirochaetes bacterium]|nr:hypothetical protein [Spirochaetota bacterium]